MVQNWIAKILLLPFSFLYGIGVSIRNMSYDSGLLKSTRFNLPIISIGNLSIGGAGKTPHVEFLLQQLIPYLDLATLSRGYKRKTKGFRIVQATDDALAVGDEPLMYKRKYRNVVVAVSESRALAIPLMVKQYPGLQGVMLDDAFQHRGIVPGLNILLTTFSEPFTRDFLLPSGRLREFRSSYERADVIIVTKCPKEEDHTVRDRIIAEIKPLPRQKIFLSRYRYLQPYSFYDPKTKLTYTPDLDIILISAIANTEYLKDYLQDQVASIHELEYEDHHIFDERDITYLNQVYTHRDTKSKVILTTEKDAVRMDVMRKYIAQLKLPIYVLPVEVEFLFDQESEFLDIVKSFFLNFKT